MLAHQMHKRFYEIQNASHKKGPIVLPPLNGLSLAKSVSGASMPSLGEVPERYKDLVETMKIVDVDSLMRNNMPIPTLYLTRRVAQKIDSTLTQNMKKYGRNNANNRHDGLVPFDTVPMPDPSLLEGKTKIPKKLLAKKKRAPKNWVFDSLSTAVVPIVPLVPRRKRVARRRPRYRQLAAMRIDDGAASSKIALPHLPTLDVKKYSKLFL